MSKLSPEELEDFILNEIDPESIAKRLIYDEYRKSGLSHKEALKKTIDAVGSITSKSISKEELAALKRAIFRIPGVIS